MRLFRRILPALCLAASPAAAQPSPLRLTYAAYFTGIEAAELQAEIAVSPQAYRMQLSFHLVGAPAALFHAQGTSRVDGRFQGDTAVPRELFSTGQSGGKNRVVQIDYQGDRPVITQLLPPVEPERDPVPPAEQAHTIDSLSAMAVLIHRVWTAGRCDSDVRTFDGRMVSEIAVSTMGEEMLEPTGRSMFSGTALRCAIEGRQLAGFWHDTDEAALHRPHRASVWFARIVPGGPLVPVHIEIETHGFGSANLYLTAEN